MYTRVWELWPQDTLPKTSTEMILGCSHGHWNRKVVYYQIIFHSVHFQHPGWLETLTSTATNKTMQYFRFCSLLPYCMVGLFTLVEGKTYVLLLWIRLKSFNYFILHIFLLGRRFCADMVNNWYLGRMKRKLVFCEPAALHFVCEFKKVN